MELEQWRTGNSAEVASLALTNRATVTTTASVSKTTFVEKTTAGAFGARQNHMQIAAFLVGGGWGVDFLHTMLRGEVVGRIWTP